MRAATRAARGALASCAQGRRAGPPGRCRRATGASPRPPPRRETLAVGAPARKVSSPAQRSAALSRAVGMVTNDSNPPAPVLKFGEELLRTVVEAAPNAV